jgi:O-antigen ligase
MKHGLDWIVGETTYRRIAAGACLALPVGLLYGRTIADTLTCVICVLFLIDRANRREWAWLRSPTTALSASLWMWLIVCSIVEGDGHAIVQSIVSIRLFLLAAALDIWVLRPEETRRRLQWVVLMVALWVAAQSWEQYLTGTNFLGYPRYGDGALTGPFLRPRAGGTYLMLFFPAFLPGLSRRLNTSEFRRAIGGLLLLVIAVATMVIIGQRMPALLLAFGLGLTALLIPRLRLPIVMVILAAAAIIALTPILSPPTYAKLVVRFTEQMAHFWTSPYGLLFTRATVMVDYHPWLGLGFDGFRDFCADPRYDRGPAWLLFPATSAADPVSCNLHPHNYYLLIATDAGLPGLGLFVALVICWLGRMWRGLRATDEPRRTALLVIVATSLWPLASTTTIFTFPNAGWLFLMIGWGLAEARDAIVPPARVESQDRLTSAWVDPATPHGRAEPAPGNPLPPAH